MKRIIAVFLLSLFLFGCSPKPEETPESETWSWVFHNGTVIQFPDAWRYIEFDGFAEGGYMYDAYGVFYMVRDGRTHEAAQIWFNEQHESVTELESATTVRFLRAETTKGYFPDRYYGTTEFVDYLILAPDDAVFHAWLPVIDQIEERETTFRAVLATANSLHDELNTFGFFGGIAVMAYPPDWEIVNWMSAGAPNLANEEFYMTIIPNDEDFWLRVIERARDIVREEITDEDIINEILFAYTDSEDASLNHIERLNHSIAMYENDKFNVYVFKLENDLWYSVSFSRIDEDTIQAEDEAIILQMIDSILLNNRDSGNPPF